MSFVQFSGCSCGNHANVCVTKKSLQDCLGLYEALDGNERAVI